MPVVTLPYTETPASSSAPSCGDAGTTLGTGPSNPLQDEARADPRGRGEAASTVGAVLDFYVFGSPKPKGSMRHVGHGRMIEQVDGTTWHDSIVWSVVAAMPSPEPFTGPLRVDVTFTVRKPTSAPKRRRTWPTTRSSGDLDKQLRRLFDAMQAAGAFGDDAQIVETHAAKAFPLEGDDAMQTPGAHVRVYRIGESE